jgi:hypothetical protein
MSGEEDNFDEAESEKWFDFEVEVSPEAELEAALEVRISDFHEWLRQYRGRRRPGDVETLFEAVFACQEERVPLPVWVIEALKREFELALRRPVGWAALKNAAQEANMRRKEMARQNQERYLHEARQILEVNPTLHSESRLAELIAVKVRGGEYEATPRTIRRHISGILAKRSKRGQG